jgi:hypothetical protein
MKFSFYFCFSFEKINWSSHALVLIITHQSSFSFSLVCEIIHPFGEENFIISLSCRWRVPNLIIWHIFLRQRALVSFIRVFPFCHPPETFFFRSISIGVLFCFVIFFLSPKRRAYFSIFFFLPRPNDALKFISSLDKGGRSQRGPAKLDYDHVEKREKKNRKMSSNRIQLKLFKD